MSWERLRVGTVFTLDRSSVMREVVCALPGDRYHLRELPLDRVYTSTPAYCWGRILVLTPEEESVYRLTGKVPEWSDYRAFRYPWP